MAIATTNTPYIRRQVTPYELDYTHDGGPPQVVPVNPHFSHAFDPLHMSILEEQPNFDAYLVFCKKMHNLFLNSDLSLIGGPFSNRTCIQLQLLGLGEEELECLHSFFPFTSDPFMNRLQYPKQSHLKQIQQIFNAFLPSPPSPIFNEIMKAFLSRDLIPIVADYAGSSFLNHLTRFAMKNESDNFLSAPAAFQIMALTAEHYNLQRDLLPWMEKLFINLHEPWNEQDVPLILNTLDTVILSCKEGEWISNILIAYWIQHISSPVNARRMVTIFQNKGLFGFLNHQVSSESEIPVLKRRLVWITYNAYKKANMEKDFLMKVSQLKSSSAFRSVLSPTFGMPTYSNSSILGLSTHNHALSDEEISTVIALIQKNKKINTYPVLATLIDQKLDGNNLRAFKKLVGHLPNNGNKKNLQNKLFTKYGIAVPKDTCLVC